VTFIHPYQMTVKSEAILAQAILAQKQE